MPDITKPLAELEEKWKAYRPRPSTPISETRHQCADELHAIRAQLDEAIAAYQDTARAAVSNVMKLQVELAALREPMACGHQRACWRMERPAPPPNELMGGLVECEHQTPYYSCVVCHTPYCTTCAHERLRVAAALREAAYLEWPHEYVKDQHGKPVTDRLCEDHRKHVLALIPDSDRSALDAALKKAEHKGFCEALHRVESSIRDPESGGDLLIMQALDAHDAEVRNQALEEARLAATDEAKGSK